jgi:hypothetical protein
VALLPLVILGFIALATTAYGLVRHDPAYFAQEYLERYSTPGEVARTLESALQNGDEELLAELQGLRWPARYEANPKLTFVMLWESTDRYFTYLYFDMQTYERQPHYIEEVDERWVMSPPDLYYYMRSGRWKGVFLPIAIVWWLVGGVTIVLVWMARVSERFRAQLYGE